MNREQQYEANKAYIEAEGLDKIIPFFSCSEMAVFTAGKLYPKTIGPKPIK